jgi:hypothetical protein
MAEDNRAASPLATASTPMKQIVIGPGIIPSHGRSFGHGEGWRGRAAPSLRRQKGGPPFREVAGGREFRRGFQRRMGQIRIAVRHILDQSTIHDMNLR